MRNLNITSDNFKVAGFETTLENGTKVQVLDYLTASAQVAKGLASKTTGTQVLYVLDIDGQRTELKGTAFKNWCEKNGIGIIHKGGATGAKEKRTFSVVFEELQKKAESATVEELKYAAKYLQDIAKEKQEAANKAEADEIKQLEARLKALKAKQKTK
jgi:lipopolysaccharide export LptBFGC system permease protein LptF